MGTLLVESLSTVVVEASGLETQSSNAGLAGLNVQHLAAEGYFQAIAYWLNERLVPQNVYAQVLADQASGYIKVLIEFERAPEPKRLLKFVCDRIYKLNSNVIEGIHLIARAVGSSKTSWEQRIRIPTPSQRQAKIAAPVASQATNQLDPSVSDTVQPTAVQPTAVQPTTVQPTVAQPTVAQPTVQLVHESSRSKVAREIVRSQFKFFRAAMISGTASAAFLFGGLTELVLSERLSTQAMTDSALAVAPWYDEGSPESTEVTFASSDQNVTSSAQRPSQRFDGRTVKAALETVAVVPHDEVAQPNDPTVTLLFGGELELDDFIFEETESLDRLFSDLNIYQQADVAMIGLSEPLATASTSLQESFYQRTRPQAVQALKRGGIDIVSLASEGTLHYGTSGLDETLRTLDRQGLYRVGAGRSQQEAHRPEILEVKGQRIAYLGYNSEALVAAKADRAGVALTNSEEHSYLLEDIRAIRPQVDWIVVNYRWGDTLDEAGLDEANPLDAPEDWQISLAHEAVDAGADLVVGYHPSRIQGAEVYRDRAIAYSLGDFVFGEAPLEDHDTAALRVSLRNHQMKIEFLPVSIRNSQIQMATSKRGTQILQDIRKASQTFEQPLHFPTVLQAPPAHIPTVEPTLEPLVEPPILDERPFTEPPATEPPTIEFEDTAPHPILKESEALFPTKDLSEDSAEESTEEDSFLEALPLEDDGETHSTLPNGIETHEEPLVGPLSIL